LKDLNNDKSVLQPEPREEKKPNFIPKYSSLLLAIDHLCMNTVADINKKYQVLLLLGVSPPNQKSYKAVFLPVLVLLLFIQYL
jgi:hypothetical protein